MLETIVVYTLLMVIMFLFTESCGPLPIKSTRAKLLCIVPILAYTLIFGCRYYVGVDYPAYLDMYDSWDLNNSIMENWSSSTFSRIEPAFILLIAFTRIFDSPVVFFSLIALIQIFFIYKAYQYNPLVLACAFVAFICTGMAMIHFQNGLRQYIAIPIFMYAFQYIINRKPLQYFLWITLAVLFHKSAAVLYFVYFLYAYRSTPYFKNALTQCILLTISITLAFVDFTSAITDKMDALLILTDYEAYVDSTALVSDSKRVSYIMLLQYLLYLFLASYRQQVADYYKDDTYFPYIYDLFFIATCFSFIFFRSLLIVRICRYFTTFEFIVIGYYLNYLIQTHRKSYRNYAFYLVVCAFLFVSYSATILFSKKNTTAYVSFFQEDLHAEKDAYRELYNVE